MGREKNFVTGSGVCNVTLAQLKMRSRIGHAPRRGTMTEEAQLDPPTQRDERCAQAKTSDIDAPVQSKC